VKTENVQCDNVKLFSSGGLIFAYNAFYFNKPFNHISHIKLYTQRKTRLLNAINCSPYTKNSFVLGRFAA